MKKRRFIKLLALLIALLMPVLTAVVAFADDETPQENTQQQENTLGESKYDSPDINALTGAGEEPEDISVTSGATYQEKAWYEYVAYSDHAVSSYRLTDDYRVLFYDPYTYTNSLVMDVEFDAKDSQFDTMSSYTISHTNSKTISSGVESTYTSTSATQTSGRDITHSGVENRGSTKTTYNHQTDATNTGTVKSETKYNYQKYDNISESISLALCAGVETSIGVEAGLKFTPTGVPIEGTANASSEISISSDITSGSSKTLNQTWLTDKVTNKTSYSNDYKTTTKYSGDDTVEYNTDSTTDGWTELSARVTKTLGSSSSTSNSWSESESTTITKTYAATHFASDGVTPLPWAIVHYRVQMPMKCCLQVKHSGEWVTLSTVYCLLTTVQGTCRAWMQNGQVYYEDWGNGEPVVATDFWSQFMTRDELISAYSDPDKAKLYPLGGED